MRYSVLFLVEHDRGLAEKAVEAWVIQSLDPRSFELVLICGDGSQTPRGLKQHIREHDRVVAGQFANHSAQYDAGIRVARGDVVFLTESHCLPVLDCLALMDEYLNPHMGTHLHLVRGDHRA